MNPPFKRTICACADCVQCCKSQSGFLIPGDVERIAAILRRCNKCHRLMAGSEHYDGACKCGGLIEAAPVKDYLWASPGAKAMNLSTGEIISIPTITPRMKDGRCVFLDENDRCKVHPVAPFGCAYADTHMSREYGQKLSLWAMRLVKESKDYQEFRATLPKATSYKPRSAL